MSRLKIKSITVEIEGKKPIVLKGKKLPSAIFLNDQGVKWLGAIYDIYGKGKLLESKAKEAFGEKKARTILGDNAQIPVSSEVIQKVWNTPDENGDLPAMLEKMQDCTFK